MQLQLNVTIDAISDYMELNAPEEFKENYNGGVGKTVIDELRAAIEDALSAAGVIGSVVSISKDNYILSADEEKMMKVYWKNENDIDDERLEWLRKSEDVFGIKHANWSMFEMFQDDETSFEWQQPLLTKNRRVVFVSDDTWGERYESKKYKHPTLKDLFVEADRSIPGTGDSHHVYLEGFSVRRNDQDVVEVHMQFGS